MPLLSDQCRQAARLTRVSREFPPLSLPDPRPGCERVFPVSAVTGAGSPALATILAMSRFVRSERQKLADLFASLGPDAPTMCTGWATRDLAAHLVIRERRHRAGRAPPPRGGGGGRSGRRPADVEPGQQPADRGADQHAGVLRPPR